MLIVMMMMKKMGWDSAVLQMYSPLVLDNWFLLNSCYFTTSPTYMSTIKAYHTQTHFLWSIIILLYLYLA